MDGEIDEMTARATSNAPADARKSSTAFCAAGVGLAATASTALVNLPTVACVSP